MPQPTEAKIWLTLLEPSHLHKGSRLLADHLESLVASRQLDRALPTINRLLILQSDCPDALEKAEIHVVCGLAAYILDDLPRAVELFRKARKLYEPHQHFTATAEWMLGLTQWQIPGERDQAYCAMASSLESFKHLSTCSTDPKLATWYAEKIKYIEDTLIAAIQQENVTFPPPSAGPTPQPAPSAGPRTEAPASTGSNGGSTGSTGKTDKDNIPQPAPIPVPSGFDDQPIPVDLTPLNPVLIRLFRAVEHIQAGMPVEVGLNKRPFAQVEIDRVIIEGKAHRIINLTSNSRVILLPQDDYLVVKVDGDSMNKALRHGLEGIQPDDYVLLRQQANANPNDIVAAEIDGVDTVATLKYLRVRSGGKDSTHFVLEPHSTNPYWEEQKHEFARMNAGFRIRGVALAVFKPLAAGLTQFEVVVKQVTPLLEMLDDLDRARETARQANASQGWLDDLKLSHTRLALHVKTTYNIVSMGIKTGDTFDPRFHKAMEKDQGRLLPPGTITAVFRQGYMLGERVVRIAQVRAT